MTAASPFLVIAHARVKNASTASGAVRTVATRQAAIGSWPEKPATNASASCHAPLVGSGADTGVEKNTSCASAVP